MHPPGDPGFEVIRKRAQVWQAPLLSVPDRGPWDWRVVKHFLRICREEQVTIWHGHDYKTNALGLLLRPFWPMRLITTVHGWVKETRRTPLYYGIDRVCLPYYEKVICVSDDLYARCLAARVPAQRCVLIENGIDTDEFTRRQGRSQAKTKLGFVPNRLLIGAVGRLSAEKGFDLLIRATDQLLKDGLDVELILVGEGDEKDRLQEQVRRLGRVDRIHMLGFRSDIKDLYEAMDVFALSSWREGLPNVLLEAMALKVPIVATRVAGVPRLIQDRENGLLLEPGNVTDLVQALTQVLTDDGLRERLRQAGRRTVESRYSFRRRTQTIRQLYDDLLGRNGESQATHLG
jgi:glycosyltransferase involved in cell wall biosynthesis